MPEEILKPIHYVNGDLEVSGSAKIKEVENGTGSIVTYDEETKELKKRTGAQIIEDLNLAAAFEVVPETISKTSTNLTTENGHTHELAQDVKNDIAKGVEAQGWGNHAQANYLKTETDPVYVASIPNQMMWKGVIPEGADLNNYTTTGIYGNGINSVVATFLNCPTNRAMQLEVVNVSGVIFQKIIDHVNNRLYIRNLAGSTWNPWTGMGLASDILNRVPFSGADRAIDYNTQIITHNGIKRDSNSIESPWLETSVQSDRKVIYLIIDGSVINTARQFIIDIESISGNGSYVKLKKTSTIQLASSNVLTVVSDNYTEVTGITSSNVRYSIGTPEKHSDTAIKIPIILIGSTAARVRNKVTVKSFAGNIQNITFSTLVDAESTLVGVAPRNTEDNYIGVDNEQLNLAGNKKTIGEWEFAKVKKSGKSDLEVLLAGGGDKSLADFAMSSQTYTKNQVNDLLAPKLEADDLDGFVNDVTYNSDTHVLTFFKQNYPNIVVDLPIESLIKNVDLSGNNLVFTFEDNTTVSVPLNTLLVGVVKEVNGKVPNSQGVITLEISDIPSLSSALDGKSNIRLSNVASDLNATEKSAIRNKVGAGTVNSVSISLPDGFAVGTATITDSGTFNISFAQGYSLPTTQSQSEWDAVVDEAVRLNGDQEIGGNKRALDTWTFNKPVVIPEGVENDEAVNVRQLGAKANRSLDNIPSSLTTQETNVIKQKLKIDNLQNTGNTYPLVISSEFTSILATIPEVTVENAVAYVRNRNLIVSITLKNAAIANTDVISANSIVKLFSLTPEISDVLQAEITAIVPHVKLTSTDVYSTATNKMFLDFEDKSIKQPFRLTLRSSSTTTFYAEFECLDM